MKLKDFIETYEGFDWENGEVAVFDQRTGNHYLCKCHNHDLKHPYHLNFDKEYEKNVHSWTHSKKTMMIIL